MHKPIRHERSITIFFTSIAFLVILFTSLLAFIWALTRSGATLGDTSFWFLFAFISGLMTIFLPCTLPLAFITVPLAREKRTLRSLGMILMFALGVSFILACYGGAFGAFGAFWMSLFPEAALAAIVPWVYFLGGLFAYALSLGELGLIPLQMPAYAGKSPDFIASKKGVGKMFFIGLFLGNVGVGCPFPAIPLLLISAILSGSAEFGVLLFLIHAIGRILPLLVLLSLATIEVDGLAWLVAHKSKFDRASGWVFIVATALLVTIGTYAHQWVYGSVLYGVISRFFPGVLPTVFGGGVSHQVGIFQGAPLGAHFVFLALILLPLWWGYFRERRRFSGDESEQSKRLGSEIEHLQLELRGHEVTLNIPEGTQRERVRELDRKIDTLLTRRRIIEEASRYGRANLESEETVKAQREALALRRNWYITLTVLLFVIFSILI